MFESDLLEFFSHIHPATPLILYLPVITFELYRAVSAEKLPILSIVGLFAFGVLLWTLVEYLIHRYLFHYKPRSRWGSKLHFLMHGVHHDYPQDATRLVMPPTLSIPTAIVFNLLIALSWGRFAEALFAGSLFGYVCYDSIHYATHHIAFKGRVGLWLKQYHLRHHYKDDHAGFGVSSPLWDYIFGTTRKNSSEPIDSQPGHPSLY